MPLIILVCATPPNFFSCFWFQPRVICHLYFDVSFIFNLDLSFLTAIFLKISHQLLCRISLSLGCSVFPHDHTICILPEISWKWGLLWWLRCKESACHAENLGSIPGFGRSPGEGHGNPLQYSCLVNRMDRGLGRLPSIGSQRVGRYWATNTHTYTSWKWGCVSPSESYQVTYNANTSHYWWCLFWSLVRVKQVYLK